MNAATETTSGTIPTVHMSKAVLQGAMERMSIPVGQSVEKTTDQLWGLLYEPPAADSSIKPAEANLMKII